MTDAGTLATSAQTLLAIGQNGSAAQILEANTNYWILFAESDMEKEFNKYYSGGNIGLVANYATITAAMKQWLAGIASHRAAMYGQNQNQNSWQLSTTQSKFNFSDYIWNGFLKDLKEKATEIITSLGL